MSDELQLLYRDFITASHILHQKAVLDAYGHLSVRRPMNPNLFIMSRAIAPGIIMSQSDLVEYRVADAEPARPTSHKGYAERHIHSEIYRRHPHVHAVVHSHADAVIPFSLLSVPGAQEEEESSSSPSSLWSRSRRRTMLRPVCHMAGFLDPRGVPLFEISDFWREGDVQDMLVRDGHTGAGLAARFDGSQAVVLMRGHGFTAVGGSIEEAVFRAVYTVKNAGIQTTALGLGAALGVLGMPGPPGKPPLPVRSLSQDEAKATKVMTCWSMQLAWEMWVREVEADKFYVILP